MTQNDRGFEMKELVVKHGSVTDALGKTRTGWLVIEDGRSGYPFSTKEIAIKQAEGIKAIRVAPGVAIRVEDEPVNVYSRHEHRSA